MAEKKISKAAATKAAKKATAEKAAPAAKAEVKKAPAAKKATAAKKAVIYVNAENVGFKAGDVYNTLAASEKALTVSEVSKKAKIAMEEAFLGIGWLLKEGKINVTEDNKVTLA